MFKDFLVRRLTMTALIAVMALPVFTFPQMVNAQDEKSKLMSLLSIKPRQQGVAYDSPTRATVDKCKAKSIAGGYVVVDGTERVLRKFVDTNKDKRLDQWSYYKDGIEVYRDVDTNFDSKADQYRWMGTSGIRWGVDTNQDGKVDGWKQISAEEIAEELFFAVQSGDARRFERLVISDREISNLGLGSKMTEVVKKSAAAARSKFGSFVQGQRKVSAKSEWVHFGTSQPNLIPKGNEGLERDVIVYDHASAVFKNGSKYDQIAIGTILKVGDGSWRIAELPHIVKEGTAVANGGIMFPLPEAGAIGPAGPKVSPEDARFAKLFKELDELKEKARVAKKQIEIFSLEKQLADLRKELVNNSRPAERSNWIDSVADTVSDAVARDRFPDGLKYLEDYYKELMKDGVKKGPDYVFWRTLNTRFSKGVMDGTRRERAEANSRYIDDLQVFIKSHANSQFAAECLNNLGMHFENADRQNPERAIDYYKKCAQNFPDTGFGKKAAGALKRLSSVGKKIAFKGTVLSRGGKQVFDLQRQTGKKIKIIHYWETGNEYCIKDFETFQRLSQKYKDELLVIGANVDMKTDNFLAFMQKNRSYNWTQLHEPGGVEKSGLAHQLGPSTLPLIVLINGENELVEAGIPADELEREIQRLIRRQANKK